MRFGIVGTNFISDFFMDGASYIKDKVEVTAVCSRRLENAQAFADKYHIEAVYDNYKEMLDSGKIDAIYIATPNASHYQMVIDSLERKMPTFCEKPLAVNYKQAKEMIDLAKKNETYLHHGIVPLYLDNFTLLKKSLDKVGKLRRAVFSMNQYSSRYDMYLAGKNPTTFRNELGNGALMDLGVYLISLSLGLFGKPKSIQANSLMLETGVDAATTLILSYDDFEAVILCSKVNNSQIVSEIAGEDAYISIEYPSLVNGVNIHVRKDQTDTLISEDYDHQFRFELQEFVKVVESGRYESSLVPYQLSLDILETITEARKLAGVMYKED